MASFGSGFSQGLGQGTAVADKWVKNYERREDEEITNQLFTAGQQLSQEGMQLDAEGNEIEGTANLFKSASADDMAGMMMKQLVANGGKITDDTAKLAYGAAEQLVGIREKAVEHDQKTKLFESKVANYNSMIGRRNHLNVNGGAGGGGGLVEEDTNGASKFGTWLKKNDYSLKGRSKTQRNKLFSRFMDDEKPDTTLVKGEEVVTNDDGTPDLSSIKVGGKLFKSLTPDAQRSIQEAQGIKGTPAPKSKTDLDSLLGDATEEEKPAVKKAKGSAAPKGVKDGKYTVRGKKVEVIDGVMYPL